jgi:mRNA interferase MazF
VRRGEIWWARMSVPTGSEPGYRRPVLVVSSDEFNASAIGTVVCAALTSNLALAAAPGNVLVKARDSKLSRDSVVNVSQLVTLDKERLTARVGRLPQTKLDGLELGLRLVLGLVAPS